jgi:hypothetical protein
VHQAISDLYMRYEIYPIDTSIRAFRKLPQTSKHLCNDVSLRHNVQDPQREANSAFPTKRKIRRSRLRPLRPQLPELFQLIQLARSEYHTVPQIYDLVSLPARHNLNAPKNKCSPHLLDRANAPGDFLKPTGEAVVPTEEMDADAE